MNTLPQVGPRNYGIDLLRIVSMYMVCVIHVLGQGGIIDACSLSINAACAGVMRLSAACAVDCFALISGYCGCVTAIKTRSLFRLWCIAVFYGLIITLFFPLVSDTPLDKYALVKALLPICTCEYWYLTSYALMFLISPQMNHLIQKQTESELRKFVWLVFVIYSILGCLPVVGSISFSCNYGYSAVWLSYLYMVGGFIRLYGAAKLLPNYCGFRQWVKQFFKRRSLFLLGYFATVVGSYLFVRVMNYLTGGVCQDGVLGQYAAYNSPIVIISAIFLLLYFKTLNVGRFVGVIRFFSPLAFSVYLIQCHPILWNYLWPDAFKIVGTLSFYLIPFVVFGISLAIYLSCSVIDYIRLLIFKLFRLM